MSSGDAWKGTATVLALVMTTALLTGLVVANLTGHEPTRDAERTTERPAPARVAAAPSPATPAIPSKAVIEACNQQAAQQTGARDKTVEIGKDAAAGAGGGTLYGLSENRKDDERYRAAYAGCMRSRGYAG